MHAHPDLSGDEGGSQLASYPTGSLLVARFLRTVVALNVVSPSCLHMAKVFKVLTPSPRRTAGWYGRATVPLVIKFTNEPDLNLLPCVDMEISLILDFFTTSAIIGPFALNAHISF